MTNGDVSYNNNDNNNEYKSVEGYATLPRRNKNSARINDDDYIEASEENQNHEQPDSVYTRSSSGVSSKYTEEDDDLLQRGKRRS